MIFWIQLDSLGVGPYGGVVLLGGEGSVALLLPVLGALFYVHPLGLNNKRMIVLKD